ncbi:MAG TPA: tRNA (adenosine(37)-N6)-threonylcarbamoyltransferase complex ATPase subunit type 1 TsaE [Chitinophagales bacterium]|nr:tRNA (adenosine(37)-N6)-threonylcarbamoyltransferase complex ATPase subunit type 1 TsaE [Chitinophagales bacterium]
MAEAIKTSINTPEQIPAVAKQILEMNEGHTRVFAFYGPMGVGKTTLIKALCAQIGATGNLSSPSYSIVNEYAVSNGTVKVYHIDLFRLKDIDEAFAVGIEEYMNGSDYCFIEWPELIEGLLPPETIKVHISTENNTRELVIFNR